MEDDNRSRALLTDTDRELVVLGDDIDVDEKDRLYQARSRIRSRIDELYKDLRLLQRHEPKIASEVLPMLSDFSWGDPETVYKGEIRDGRNIVTVDGDLLDPRTDVADPSQTGAMSWGYNGAGPRQLAVALLAHATDPDMAVEYYSEFGAAYTYRDDMGDQWEIEAAEIQNWIEDMNGGNDDHDGREAE